MRRFIFPVILAALPNAASPRAATAQAATDSTKDPETRAVVTARAVYAQTNRERATYRPVERRVLGLSAESAGVIGLYRNSELRKVEVTWYGESGKVAEEYYLDGGRLVFCYSSEQRYDQPFGRVVRRRENRYYFDDGGRLVRWINSDGRRVAAGSPAYREAESEIGSTLRPLLRALAGTDSTYEVDADSTTTSGRDRT